MGNAIDWDAFGDIKDAARTGNYGYVIRRARQVAGLSQKDLADGVGLSQTAISRMENRGPTGTYNMEMLAKAATVVGIPFELVGLASQSRTGQSSVERRNFVLTAAVSVAAAPLSSRRASPPEHETSQPAALRLVTSAYRRLDASSPSRDLADVIAPHLRFIQGTVKNTPDPAVRQHLSAVGSEASSFLAWLSWDMADHGSARRWYGSAITAARQSGNTLLTAYQMGSLASFEAELGNAHAALSLMEEARRQFGTPPPPLASAWMSSIEAVAHAENGDHRACGRALRTCVQHAERIADADPVAWPWIFAFDERKISACRVTCAARLGGATTVGASEQDIAIALTSGHDKQRALLSLDVAAGNLAVRDRDAAFTLATRALTEGLRLRSGRVVEKARRFRRGQTATATSSTVREFDTLLHTAYL
ncbi:helix-turn-helix domain-containing protein [Streptomyces uncialis]|uniref:helix-turn-helix domain-containing protein n=1 Tax=Streptomyces uncialis TaxID=1048205 RepID=UPI0033CDCCB2